MWDCQGEIARGGSGALPKTSPGHRDLEGMIAKQGLREKTRKRPQGLFPVFSPSDWPT
jgi:hypothetical protein